MSVAIVYRYSGASHFGYKNTTNRCTHVYLSLLCDHSMCRYFQSAEMTTGGQITARDFLKNLVRSANSDVCI